jgi:hypothetical protein
MQCTLPKRQHFFDSDAGFPLDDSRNASDAARPLSSRPIAEKTADW